MSKQQRERVDKMMRRTAWDSSQSPEQMRESFARMSALAGPPGGVRVSGAALGGRPALLVEPLEGPPNGPAEGAGRATILYFHGGSHVFGSPATAVNLTADVVRRTGTRAFSLDYRLAPEHPFPADVEDGVSAYRELLTRLEPARIAFVGDSAGGALTVSVMLAARDAGLPMPAAAVAFSPSLDLTRSGASMDTRAEQDPVFSREGLTAIGHHYLAGQDPRQPLLSPAVLGDLTGLAPLLLQAGSNEVLLDDSTRFAVRAAAAGVDVMLDVTADVPHVFQSFAGILDEADLALDRAALFLRQRLPG